MLKLSLKNATHQRASIVGDHILLWFSFLTLLIIPFRVTMYHYTPLDDANRHVAKAVSGRAWPEILVMRDDYVSQDHNEGWHTLLAWLHQAGADKEALLLISVIGLFLVLVLSGLVIFRHEPLAWIAALMVIMLFASPTRFMSGRPYLIAATCFLLLLHIWNKPSQGYYRAFFCTSLLVALSGWLHGGWYLFFLLPVGLVLSGRLHDAMRATASWLVGALLAGLMTGHPYQYLVLQIKQSLASTGSAPVTRLLVSEFQPAISGLPLIFVALVVIAIHLFKAPTAWYLKSPAFWLTITGWVLGNYNGRFWIDWGVMACAFWMASVFARLLEHFDQNQSMPTKYLQGFTLCLALFINVTVDAGSRWSNSDFVDPLSMDDPAHKEWLPDPGGILYSESMITYYRTFYENPHGPWRYMLGHEPALMPQEDLDTFREIQFYSYTLDHLYKPWVEKMTQADRLVLTRSKSNEPEIQDLEWSYVAFDTWVGRKPSTSAGGTH